MQRNTDSSVSEPVKSMRPFFAIWSAQAFSLLGSELVQFALVWWLTDVTGSATVLALASAMALLPQVLVGPVAGALIDRLDRRVVMQLADGAIALATLVLVGLFAAGLAQPWHIYTVMLVRGLGTAFHWPAMQASTTLLVPEDKLTKIAGLNQSLEGLSRILMPPLGALLLQFMPIQNVLVIDIATAALAVLPLFFVHIPRVGEGENVQANVMVELRAGLSYVRENPGLLAIIILGPLFSLLMFPALSFQPLLVTRHFQAGAVQLAWMQSAYGIGIVLGGLTLGAWGGFKSKRITGFAALVLRGVALAVVGLTATDGLSIAIAAMFLTGFWTPITTGSLFALIQSAVPPTLQGRVFTLLRSGFTSAPLIGLLIAGPLADVWGVRPWFVLAGVAMAFIGCAGFAIRSIQELEHASSAATSSAPTAAD